MELVIDAASGRSELSLSLLRLGLSESLLMPLQAGTPQDTTRATVTVPLSTREGLADRPGPAQPAVLPGAPLRAGPSQSRDEESGQIEDPGRL